MAGRTREGRCLYVRGNETGRGETGQVTANQLAPSQGLILLAFLLFNTYMMVLSARVNSMRPKRIVPVGRPLWGSLAVPVRVQRSVPQS
jgi:hypothetical protein